MAETTNQKTGGATEVRDMIRNAGLDQREIQTLEAYLRNGIQNLQHPSARQRDDSQTYTAIELAQVRGGVTDAGIDLWRTGPVQQDRSGHVHTFADLNGTQRVADNAKDCDHCPEQEAGAGRPIRKAISTGQP